MRLGRALLRPLKIGFRGEGPLMRKDGDEYLPAPVLLDIAIFVTALSWGIGFYVVDRKAHVFS